MCGDLNLLSIISKRHLDKQRRPRSDASELDVISEPTEFSFKSAIEKKMNSGDSVFFFVFFL